MIPKASQRANGSDLATHLLRLDQNERISDLEIRGAVARDLHGAFDEWALQAQNLTRCENFLYSLSINPDPDQEPWTREMYDEYIARVEEAQGLKDQPRALLFHKKQGREHCHVVWSRIRADEGKAVHLGFDHLILMEVSRSFARDYGIELADDYGRKEGSVQQSFYDRAQEQETGLTLSDHRKAVTEAWQVSDSPQAFMRALEERGYLLATGKRPYVLVDAYGHTHALRRMIDEPGIKQKHLDQFLGAYCPPEILPTVDEARQIIKRLGNVREDARRSEKREAEIKELEARQEERRKPLEERRKALITRLDLQRDALTRKHREEQQAAKDAFRAERGRIQERRRRMKPTGLLAFLGRVTGMDREIRKWMARNDRKRLHEFVATYKVLKDKQADEAKLLKQEQILERRVLDKKERALNKVLNRERRELEKKLARDYRRSQRKHGNAMPSLRNLERDKLFTRGGLATEMAKASGLYTKTREKGDLSDEFTRSASGEAERDTDERQRVPRQRERRRRRRDRNRDRER